MAEFVLLMLPFAYLCSAQLAWLADVIERTELRAATIEVARYAALADITPGETSNFLGQKLEGFAGASGQVTFGPLILVTAEFPSHQITPFAPTRVKVDCYVKRELD